MRFVEDVPRVKPMFSDTGFWEVIVANVFSLYKYALSCLIVYIGENEFYSATVQNTRFFKSEDCCLSFPKKFWLFMFCLRSLICCLLIDWYFTFVFVCWSYFYWIKCISCMFFKNSLSYNFMGFLSLYCDLRFCHCNRNCMFFVWDKMVGLICDGPAPDKFSCILEFVKIKFRIFILFCGPDMFGKSVKTVSN